MILKKEIQGKSTLVQVSEGSNYRESATVCKFVEKILGGGEGVG